jgi:hypothetical protein
VASRTIWPQFACGVRLAHRSFLDRVLLDWRGTAAPILALARSSFKGEVGDLPRNDHGISIDIGPPGLREATGPQRPKRTINPSGGKLDDGVVGLAGFLYLAVRIDDCNEILVALMRVSQNELTTSPDSTRVMFSQETFFAPLLLRLGDQSQPPFTS